MERELGVSYSTLRRLLEREIDEESLGFIKEEEEIFLALMSIASDTKIWYTR